MKVLATGSGGLIGLEAVEHFDRQGREVTGVDNNMRREFFGLPWRHVLESGALKECN
jgi:CDP-paratose 2-epimerase